MRRTRRAAFAQTHPRALRVPVLAPNLRHEAGDGDLVVYVLPTQELMMFNLVGAGVYLLIDGERSIADIVDILADALPTERDVALQDVEAFLQDLAERGALSFRPPSADALDPPRG